MYNGYYCFQLHRYKWNDWVISFGLLSETSDRQTRTPGRWVKTVHGNRGFCNVVYNYVCTCKFV